MVDNPNSKHINHINQLLHNKGIKQEDRIGVLTTLFEKRKTHGAGSGAAAAGAFDPRFSDIMDAINAIDFTNKEISQELFMLFGSKLTRYKLDQFYTPLTISEFITAMMIPGKAAVDPAGGTGDLLVHYAGETHIWDIDEHALELCRFNYELNRKTNYHIQCKNSLVIASAPAAAFDYVTMNPPFGSSTVITDNNILQHYELGLGRKKQEIGILFLELGLKLLKPDGILFAIVPAGYVGNSTKPCMELREMLLRNRVITSIELPKQSFKRSGTGVNTYILMIQKKAAAATAETAETESYPICISTIENIGYELTKANTPIKYKIVRETGEICVQDGVKIVDNDLVECASRLAVFARDFNIPNMTTHDDGASASASASAYESVMSGSLQNLILDVKRYSSNYVSLVTKLKSNPGCVPIHKIAQLVLKQTKIEKQKKYKYIDIGEISTPLYGSKELYGWELPSRAKYSLKKYDILVSKLEGNVSYCIILDDSDNYISTNGVSVIRPYSTQAAYILFANITKKDFIIQHNAYLTGSIMASLSDNDIGEIMMDTRIDLDMTKKMVDALTALTALRL